MKAPSPQLERQREWHGWAFSGYTDKQASAIRHYIDTGEKTEDLPGTVRVEGKVGFGIYAQVTTGPDRTDWVIKTHADVAICRSPKRYKTRDEAIESLNVFMEAVNRD